MKKIIILFLLIIGMIGCNDKDKKTELVIRKGIIYALNGKNPYTGFGGIYYDDENIEAEGKVKGGKAIGEWKFYYYGGKIKRKGKYIEGKMEGSWIYYNYDGSVEEVWYKDGKEREE
jgi:antitoxin component YwqK of YwqJK toxin-antitoxin module